MSDRAQIERDIALVLYEPCIGDQKWGNAKHWVAAARRIARRLKMERNMEKKRIAKKKAAGTP